MRRRCLDVVCSPRPWLSRRGGECAFPVDGDGWTVRSCCNPCAAIAIYCPAHRRVLRGRKATPIDELEAQLRAVGI